MRHCIYIITFPDGLTVTGECSASTPYDSPPVVWSGQMNRLPKPLEKASPRHLKIFLSNLAKTCGGKLTEKTRGNYDVGE